MFEELIAPVIGLVFGPFQIPPFVCAIKFGKLSPSQICIELVIIVASGGLIMSICIVSELAQYPLVDAVMFIEEPP